MLLKCLIFFDCLSLTLTSCYSFLVLPVLSTGRDLSMLSCGVPIFNTWKGYESVTFPFSPASLGRI